MAHHEGIFSQVYTITFTMYVHVCSRDGSKFFFNMKLLFYFYFIAILFEFSQVRVLTNQVLSA
jgi:hypothetical protein